MTPISCKSCGALLTGPYCAQCGQKVITGFSLKYLWQSFHADVLEVEQGLWPTFWQLTTRPGKMIRSFLDGNTKRYYSPIKYLAIVATAFFIIMSLSSDNASFLQWDKLKERVMGNELRPFSIELFGEISGLPMYLMANGQLLFYFIVVLPLTAFTARIFFRKLNFTELTITLMYAWGNALAWLLIASPLLSLVVLLDNSGSMSIFLGILAITILLLFFYFTWIFRTLTGGRWITTAIKLVISLELGIMSCLVTIWVVVSLWK